METTFSLHEIKDVAEKILAQNPKKVVLFNGEMGAGKTTLIKELCLQLGVLNSISSPTFSLVNEYQTTNNHMIYHFDCYRLKSETEALDFGIEDYLYSGNYCFIEWSEKIPSLLPTEHSIISLEIVEDGKRKINLI